MTRTFLKYFVRSFAKYRLINILSIVGMSIGISVGILFLSNIEQILKTDSHHQKKDNIYRVLTIHEKNGKKSWWATTPSTLQNKVNALSEVELSSRMLLNINDNIQTKIGQITTNIAMGDSNTFKIFDYNVYPVLDPNITDFPNYVLITQSLSDKLFQKGEDPVGKVITLAENGPCTVAGIIKSAKNRSHINFDVLFLNAKKQDQFIKNAGITENDYLHSTLYILSKPGVSETQLYNNLKTIGQDESQESNDKLTFASQNLNDITPWDPKIANDFNAGPNWKGIATQLFLAFAITILSGLNYILLNLSKTLTRTKELAVRKVFGATKRSLVMESFLNALAISTIALLLSVPILILITYFKLIPFVSLTIYDISPVWILVSILYTVATALLAGLVPSIFASNTRIAAGLQNIVGPKKRVPFNLQNILVSTQFIVTAIVMVTFFSFSTMQQSYVANFIEPTNANIYTHYVSEKNKTEILEKINSYSGVSKVTISDYLPSGAISKEKIKIKSTLNEPDLEVYSAAIDSNFANTYDLKFIAGRNFKFGDEKNSILLNEAAFKKIFNEKVAINSLDETIRADSTTYKIAGILSDASFNTNHMFPIIFRNNTQNSGNIVSFHFSNPENIAKLERDLESLYHERNITSQPIVNYKHDLQGSFENGTQNLNSIVSIFIVLITAISAIGLFGLSSITYTQKIFTLSIRKLLGATDNQIMLHSFYPMMKLVVISLLAATPVMVFVVHQLSVYFEETETFFYLDFLLGFAVILFISQAIVALSCYKVLFLKPVTNLNDR